MTALDILYIPGKLLCPGMPVHITTLGKLIAFFGDKKIPLVFYNNLFAILGILFYEHFC